MAAGTGSRLRPLTATINKHLLPVFDKPMIYYSISVLMLAGVRQVLIVCRGQDLNGYRKLLGDGSSLGLRITFKIQESSNGIAEGLILAEDFVDESPFWFALGDNLFFGNGLSDLLQVANQKRKGAVAFGYAVKNPSNFGVVKLDSWEQPIELREKPKEFISNLAITGLYLFDSESIALAKNLRASERGELEILDVLSGYLESGSLQVLKLGRGYAWLDMGTVEDLLRAGEFVELIQQRQGTLVGSLEEIAFRLGYITEGQLRERLTSHAGVEYSNTVLLSLGLKIKR